MVDRNTLWARWAEVDRLLDRLLDLPEAQRAAELPNLCGDDDDLRRVLEGLLDALEGDVARVSAPGPALVAAAFEESDPDLAPGEAVGRYRIVGRLGEGGMATVYEARRDDGAYEQVAALKVLRRGLDTDRVVERFLRERQILSGFEHPNVARLLDGGTTLDGRPFLVMEKVDGVSLDRWSDENRLGIAARLELFLQVADVVMEAHRRLVVHRDLKPSNILVDRSGRVRLLDFGIARILHPGSGEEELTRLDPPPLTRRWASPEQLRGEPVTVSSDIYQLGLLLLHLLAGPVPHREPGQDPGPPLLVPTRALAAAAEADRTDRARARGLTPRALHRALAGDLDVVVARALAAEPTERYRSVQELADDVRRHLDGRPIRARPAPWTLRTRKWLRRNRWATPVAAVALAAVAGYGATLHLNAQRLERERNEARAQAERAERIRAFLVETFRTADPWTASEPGGRTDVPVSEALAGTLRRARTELADDPATQAELLSAVASILANLDRGDEARPVVQEALSLRERLGQARTPAYAADLQVLAAAVRWQQPDSAESLLTQAVELLDSTLPEGDPRLAGALHGLQWFRYGVKGLSDPTAGERAAAILENAGPAHRQELAGVLGTLAQLYTVLGRLDDAEETARRALALREAGLGSDDTRTALTRVTLAQVFDARQQLDEAATLYLESLEVLEKTLGPDHDQTLATRNNLATTYHQSGRIDDAVALHRRQLDARLRLAGGEPDSRVAVSLQNLAAALKDAGELAEADALTSRAYEVYRATTPEGHPSRAFPLLTRAEILLRRGDDAQAESMAREALSILDAALPAGHFAVGVARCRLGGALARQDRLDEARPLLESGLEMVSADPRTPPAYREECGGFASALGPG